MPSDQVNLECETDVISKFIRIVQVALECSNSNFTRTLETEDQIFANKILDIFQPQNGSYSYNETTSIPFTVDTGASNQNSIGDSTRPMHRLQHLEMIKVAVLIFVISIIMLTTCRMVFQLFVKFRPEKPQDF